MADGYERWDEKKEAPVAQAQPSAGYEAYNIDREVEAPSSSAGKMGLLGMGAGAGAWMLRGALRKALPGFPGLAKTSSIKRIDEAIKGADSASSFRNEFGEYLRMVANTDSPITLADFFAQRPGMKPVVGVIKEMMAHSGDMPRIESMLGERLGDAQKKRILAAIAEAMGVEQKGISQGMEDLMRSKSDAAAPLYAKAFQNKRPVQDSRLLELFGTETPNMAMMNALRSRLRTLSLEGREPPSLYAASPERRDAWKRLQTTDIPEHMFSGDEWKKLRPYYAPAIEDLHWMRRNLWDARETAKRSGDSETARAYTDAWKKLTDYLDTATGGDYRKARQQYKGDSDMLAAFEVGSGLLKMKPDEARAAIRKMGRAEREALSAGFYGGLEDLSTLRFLREFVARPERYPERQELLSTVFRDPTKLRNFMDSMKAEEAMQASGAAFGDLPITRDPGPRMPYARISEGVGAAFEPKATLIQSLANTVGWPSRRASRAGTDMLFREPHRLYETGGGFNWGHDDWGRVRDTPLGAAEIARQGLRWTGYGGLGGLGLYGASEASGWTPAWLGQDRP
jgi:hypothetical protein